MTSTRWPTSRVGSIDSEGIWYGLTMNAWIPSASPRASATMITSSPSAPAVLWGRGTFSLLPFRTRPARRLLGRRLGVLDAASSAPLSRLLPAIGALGRLLLAIGLLRLASRRLLLAIGRRRVGDLGLGLADRDALGVDGLGLRLGDDHLVRDAPAPLGDPGAPSDLVAQVVELRPLDVAAGGHLELLDLRRVQRERPLDAHAEGVLADGEGLARPAALALDHDALEDLGPLAVALDDLEVHADAVPGAEIRPLLEDALLEALDDCAHGVRMVACGLEGGKPVVKREKARAGGPRRREW